MKVYIKEFNSCVMRKEKISQYRRYLAANGHELVARPEEGDAALIWTCGFRGDFRDGSVFAINTLKKRCRGKIFVAGCLPDIDRDAIPGDGSRTVVVPWKQDNEVMEAVFGGAHRLASFSEVFCEPRLCEDTALHRQQFPEEDCTFHDQFIKLVVSEGCLFNCSYCSEKLAFPPFRSFDPGKLVEACRAEIEKSGSYDVMLMADSLGQYGADIGSSLPSLMEAILKLDSRVKIALNNMNPANFIEFADDMNRLIAEGRIRHLNLPIQSASDRMLRRMNRPYTRARLEDMYDLLGTLEFTAHDTHLIVGFPGETRTDIEETLEFMSRYKPRYSLVSIYMEAPGCVAASLPGKVAPEEALRRMRIMERGLAGLGIICNADGGQLSRFRLERLAAKN